MRAVRHDGWPADGGFLTGHRDFYFILGVLGSNRITSWRATTGCQGVIRAGGLVMGFLQLRDITSNVEKRLIMASKFEMNDKIWGLGHSFTIWR